MAAEFGKPEGSCGLVHGVYTGADGDNHCQTTLFANEGIEEELGEQAVSHGYHHSPSTLLTAGYPRLQAIC